MITHHYYAKIVAINVKDVLELLLIVYLVKEIEG